MGTLSRLRSKFSTASSADSADLAGSSAESRLFEHLRGLLASTHATPATIAVALLLTSTSLTIGLTGDDYLQKLMVRERPGVEGVQHSDLNLFGFASGGPDAIRGLMNEGLAPWWAQTDLHFEFWRPLSSLTHQLDYRLWPEQPVVMHAHSMLWFAALLWVVSQVYRRFMVTPWVAGLALLLYAIDDARAAPVGWLSNRNALIATLFPLLGLLAHDSWRKEGRRASGWLAPLWFALGFAAGEASVQIAGYLLAYALFLDPGSARARLKSLLPFASLFVLWRIIYLAGEYGVRGSSFYVDPLRDPLYFAEGLLVRLPLLLLAQFALPYAELWDLLAVLAPQLQPVMMVYALAVIAFVGWLLWPLLARDRLARFWAFGLVVATLPACAAVPNDRLLIGTGIGGAALIARFLSGVAEGTFPREGRLVKAAAIGAVALHALFSPIALPVRAKAVGGLEIVMRRADKSIPSDASITEREVVLLNPPVDPLPIYFAGFREAQHVPRPHYLRWLATGVSDLTVTRLDDHTLNLRPRTGYLSNSSQWVLRDRRTKSYVGETIELADCTIVVASITEDARPLDVRVRFHEPLESPRLSFMQWGRHEYVPFRLPRTGESVTLPAVDMKSALLGLGLSDS